MDAPLPAVDRTHDRRDVRRRGVDPVAGAERRTRAAGRVHPARRGDGPDRGDRRLGASRRSAARTRCGEPKASTLEMGFNLSPRQLWQPELVDRIVSPLVIAGHGSHPGHRRDHRVDRDDRPGPHARDPPGDARSRAPARDRRLRHGLLVPRATQAHAGRHPEDRPVVRARYRSGPRRRQHGLGDDLARDEPGDDAARRRDRDRGRVAVPRRPRLHAGAGLPLLAPGAAGGDPGASPSPRRSRSSTAGDPPSACASVG